MARKFESPTKRRIKMKKAMNRLATLFVVVIVLFTVMTARGALLAFRDHMVAKQVHYHKVQPVAVRQWST
jgi:cell division protein FtsI/penicillin-binding protein 2